ncbi:MAG TPA: glycoside hydrolase family 3 N-terminal domain-containing protein [Candidatus Baltobacteraceae bacterium]|nr:glycoside hydrolase family 3 N-terminal domain-containing protein [Candidatus Baltobacteraceae bacterium]
MPRFGGYLLFAANGENVASVRAVTDALRARHAGDTPPIVAIDQEGGRVARLRHGVEPMPSMMALGAAGDLDLAQRAGEQIAFDVRRAGCTLDFAPVLDLALEPGNTVIGTRSFGSDPAAVAALAQRVARGLLAGGVVPCYKHFPGHGSTHVDSHVALPVVDADEATLRVRDFAPFAAVAKDAPAMMAAHVLLRAIDPDAAASLSSRVGVTLLRGEFGFRGAYLTDCLEMGAVSGEGKTVDASVVALRAGADLLLFSHQPEVAAQSAVAIEKAVETGDVPRSRLEEAYAHVAALRAAGQPPLPLDAFPPHPGVGREIARRAVTVIRGVPHADPTSSCVVDFGGGRPSLRAEAPVLEELQLTVDPEESGVAQALSFADHSRRRPIVLSRRAHVHPAQAAAVERIVARFSNALVISMLEPYDLQCFGDARHLLAVYGDDAASIGGLADVIFGGIMAQGKLPVEYAVAVG